MQRSCYHRAGTRAGFRRATIVLPPRGDPHVVASCDGRATTARVPAGACVVRRACYHRAGAREELRRATIVLAQRGDPRVAASRSDRGTTARGHAGGCVDRATIVLPSRGAPQGVAACDDRATIVLPRRVALRVGCGAQRHCYHRAATARSSAWNWIVRRSCCHRPVTTRGCVPLRTNVPFSYPVIETTYLQSRMHCFP